MKADQVMATLNLSTNGTSISKSYQSVVSSPAPTGPAAASPTYGQWAIYSVSTPLVSAFQQDAGGKESVLKVQSTGGMPSLLTPARACLSSDLAQRESWST